MRRDKSLTIYYVIIAVTALGLGLSNDVFSNYFKEVYNVSAYQRGLIEFPRELPGILFLVVIAVFSGWSDIRLSMLAQTMSIFGLLFLGLLTPPFAVMLIFVFINSMGMHLFFPLQDSIGISLIKDGGIGRGMGKFKGISTAFSMAAGIVVFTGFKTGLFSFGSGIKWIFLVSGSLLFVVLILFVFLDKSVKSKTSTIRKPGLVFRKEYKYYYGLVIMYGLQKQMVSVYGPWVLIDILLKKADTMALLGIIGSFAGIFFIPAVGRWLDKYGIKKLLYADAVSFIVVYFLYGILTWGFDAGFLAKVGIPVIFAYSMFVFDRMSMQMSIVRTVYLKNILIKDEDLMPTLSAGQGMDHVVSIIFAYIAGLIWSIYGPQYLFLSAGMLSFVNLYIAYRSK